MSEVKFACPVCGQHIKCDSAKSGSQMECPTCFRKMVVPQAPAGDDSKLVLTASAVQSRPVPNGSEAGDPAARRKSSRGTTAFVIAMVAVACAAAGAVFAFRDRIFSAKSDSSKAEASSIARPGPVDSGTNWTLNLADRKIPQARASGFINGQSFALERATVQGGVLSLRQGAKTPGEMFVTIHLFARQGEDLANQKVNIAASRTNAPRIVLRWKNDQDKPVTHSFREGYAMRIEFGAVEGKRLNGKIYLCVPDSSKSWIAGNFTAEIRKPAPPKAPKTSKPITQSAPKR